MMHQFRDKKQIEQKRKLTKNLIFLVVFMVLATGGIFAYTKGFLHFIGRPIWKVEKVASESVQNVGYIFRTKSSVYKENENLKQENINLKLSMIDYNLLKEENIKLKELLGRTESKKNLVLSNILTKPNYSPYDTIIIDIGSKEDVIAGDKVYSDVVNPIGEVSVVYDDTSLVTLYSNPGEVTEAMLDGSNTSVELIGRGGGNFEMTIPVDLAYTYGGLVYLPNIQTQIIAIIGDVISSPTDPLKKVLLSSPVNVQNLKWVLVEK